MALSKSLVFSAISLAKRRATEQSGIRIAHANRQPDIRLVGFNPKNEMAMSANTFGTFLDTIKSLESVPAASKKTSESELLVIAKALMSQNGEAPLPLV